MQVIDLDELFKSMEAPAMKMIRRAIDDAKKDDEVMYVKKATACRILDCDGKTFNSHFAGRLDVYYLGDSSIKRFLRKDVEKLAVKVTA